MRVEVCIPAGRPRYLKVLVRHLLANRDEFDIVNLWLNICHNEDDEKYIRGLERLYPDTFKVIDMGAIILDWRRPVGFIHYHRYLAPCKDLNTIYVKMDDDIVWMEPGAITRLVKFRIDNPNYLIVVGNIINNCLLNNMHNRGRGLLKNAWGDYRDNINNVQFMHKTHNTFTKDIIRGDISVWKFDRYEVDDYRRAPNHVYAWFGKDANMFELTKATNRDVADDEAHLTSIVAKDLKRKVCYVGDAVFVHYSYDGSHEHLDNNTDVLCQYEILAP